jgi:nitrate reductase gamma subunit
MMEYVLTGIAGIAIIFLVILLFYNRRQEIKIKKSIREIKKIRAGEKDYFKFFE